MLEKQELFEARSRGYYIYRIPSLQVTPGGVVLAACEARGGTGGDWDDSDILLRRSLDGGRTWLPATQLIPGANLGPAPLNNVMLASVVESKAVYALFCHDYKRVFSMRSLDDGASFSPPREITSVFETFHKDYPWQVVALGPGHATRLRNGRILIPFWMSDGSGTEFGMGVRGHRPSCVALVYSEDGGESWQPGEIVVAADAALNPSETVCVERCDGSVLFNIRNESPANRRLISISPDGIRSWSQAVFAEDLLEPVCMAGLIRHSWPRDGQPGRILFSNPANLEREFASWGVADRDRKRLTIRCSLDDGATWPLARVLEHGPSAYSDLAVLPDGTILCFYENGMLEHKGDTRALTLARFNLAWLEERD